MRGLINFSRGIAISRKLNFYMSYKLLHTGVSRFWDIVPLGRVLNRFSRDAQIVDREMPFSMNIFISALCACLLDFTMSTLGSSQLLWIFIITYFVICLRMQRYYMHSLRELTRLQAISQSPVVQIFQETLSGVTNIRVFEKQKEITETYWDAIDENYKNQLMLQSVRCWFGIRMEFMSLMIIIPGFFFALFWEKSPGKFAVLLKFILSITEDINLMMTSISNQENRFISFERCCYFVEIEPEQGYHGLKEVEDRFFKNLPIVGYKSKELNTNWLKEGKLEFRNFSVKYRPELPYVLRNIKLTVKPGTKVGIVGRTGAGKTTLLSAIHRNFENYDGDIVIDGHEIRS